jgi:cytochrome c oxidase subunit 2
VRCAEICGRLHYDMQADISVVPGSEFNAWLVEQAAGCTLTDAECGQRWAQTYGCVACHSINGDEGVGPTWLGVFGHEVQLADGSTVVADQEYILTSIIDPNAHIVAGFQPGIMPQDFDERLSEAQIQQIIAFIMSLESE